MLTDVVDNDLDVRSILHQIDFHHLNFFDRRFSDGNDRQSPMMTISVHAGALIDFEGVMGEAGPVASAPNWGLGGFRSSRPLLSIGGGQAFLREHRARVLKFKSWAFPNVFECLRVL